MFFFVIVICCICVVFFVYIVKKIMKYIVCEFIDIVFVIDPSAICRADAW